MEKIIPIINAVSIDQLTTALNKLFYKELKCQRWDFFALNPSMQNFRLIYSNEEGELNKIGKKYLSEFTEREILLDKSLKVRKLFPHPALSEYEKRIAGEYKFQLILPFDNSDNQLIAAIFFYFKTEEEAHKLIEKLHKYLHFILSSINKCFLIESYKKKIDKYIIKARYREFYNDIVKLYNPDLHPNEYFYKVANEINLFLGTPLIIYRRWIKNLNILKIEEMYSSIQTKMDKGISYSVNESISSLSYKKNKMVLKKIMAKSIKFRDEADFLNEGLTSMLLMPLMDKNEILGDIIFLERDKFFSIIEITLLKEIVFYLKSIFINYHLYELLKGRLDMLNLILSISQQISSSLDVNIIIENALNTLIDNFQYDNCALLLTTPDNEYLYIHSAKGYDSAVVKEIKLKIGKEGITGYAAATGETTIVEDVSKDPRYVQGVAGAIWEVAVPLKIGQRVIGVLDVESKRERKIDYAELSFLEILSSYIASAISNSVTYQKELKRASQLNAINKIAAIIGGCETLESLFRESLNLIKSNFRYYSTSFWLYKNEQKKLIRYISVPEDNISISNECSLEEGLIGYSVKYKASIKENNVERNPYYKKFDAKVKSKICVPIIIDEQVFGVLDVQSDEADAFDEQDLSSLEIISRHLAVSIKKISLIEKLHQQAITDPLTNLANRRQFNYVLRREINRAIRMQRALSLIILDLDYFKNVNDRYGHLIGDQVLIRISKILSANARAMDLVSRIGGDEFAIILPEVDGNQAVNICERIRNLLANTFIEPIGFITASFGISSFSELIHSPDEFITQADNAMYQAKKAGRNRIFKW